MVQSAEPLSNSSSNLACSLVAVHTDHRHWLYSGRIVLAFEGQYQSWSMLLYQLTWHRGFRSARYDSAPEGSSPCSKWKNTHCDHFDSFSVVVYTVWNPQRHRFTLRVVLSLVCVTVLGQCCNWRCCSIGGEQSKAAGGSKDGWCEDVNTGVEKSAGSLNKCGSEYFACGLLFWIVILIKKRSFVTSKMQHQLYRCTSVVKIDRILQNKDALRGKAWVAETELRKSSVLKGDKTGRAIMTILRHVGRIAEVNEMFPPNWNAW